jgi:hypothetical protein
MTSRCLGISRGVTMACALAIACNSGSATSSSDASTPSTTTSSSSTTPGLLVLTPQGRVLTTGATAQITIGLVDSSGAPQAAPTNVTWSTSDPTTLTVDANGLVTAAGPGAAVILATDGQHGTQMLPIAVASPGGVPTGPTGIEFTPPLVQLQPGGTAHVTVLVRDANGNVVAPAPTLTLTSANSNVASCTSSAGTLDVEALSPGLTFISPQSGTPIAGNLAVLVPHLRGSMAPPGSGADSGVNEAGAIGESAGSSDAASTVAEGGGNSGPSAPSGSPPAGTCNGLPVGPGTGASSKACSFPGDYYVSSCDFTNGGTVAIFTQPGLTDPIRVFAMYEPQEDCALGTPTLYSQLAPDAIHFTTPGVASYSASTGIMSALAPGSSTYQAYVNCQECNVDSAPPVRVGVDPGGVWGISGDNQDTGRLTLPAVVGKVRPGATWGGGTGVVSTSVSGMACVTNVPDMFDCSGDASANSSGGPGAVTDQLCSDATPCFGDSSALQLPPALSFSTCADARMLAPIANDQPDTSVSVYGNDHVKAGGYDFTRGGGGSCDSPDAAAPPCAPFYGTYAFKFPAAQAQDCFVCVSTFCSADIGAWSGTVTVSASGAVMTMDPSSGGGTFPSPDLPAPGALTNADGGFTGSGCTAGFGNDVTAVQANQCNLQALGVQCDFQNGFCETTGVAGQYLPDGGACTWCMYDAPMQLAPLVKQP